MTKVLDHGYVGLVPSGCWGSDESIIEAARMSTDKGFQGWGPNPCEPCEGIGWINIPEYGSEGQLPVFNETMCAKCKGSGEIAGDEKLLKYLYQHKHMTPFEMAGLTIEVQAPIMVFREWHRHRTQSYNELSARYTPLPDLYYIPSIERLMNGRQATKNKQASQEGFTAEQAEECQTAIALATSRSRAQYEFLLDKGVAREIARLVIPVNQYSRMRASANLRNWLGFLTLRLDKGAQWEIRQYANAVADLVKQLFPRAYSLFDEGR